MPSRTHLRIAFLLLSVPFVGILGQQKSSDIRWSFAGGLTVPMSNLSNGSGVGLGVAARAAFPLNNQWDLRGDASFDGFGSKSQGGGTSSSATMFGLAANGQYHTDKGLYVWGGAGFYDFTAKLSNGNTTVSTSTWNPGIQLGLGIPLDAAKKWAAEVAFTNDFFSSGGTSQNEPWLTLRAAYFLK